MAESTRITHRGYDKQGNVVSEQSFEVTVPVCDFCNDELSDMPGAGGGLFARKATCSECWESMHAAAKRHDELRFWTPCPSDEGLASWIKRTCW